VLVLVLPSTCCQALAHPCLHPPLIQFVRSRICICTHDTETVLSLGTPAVCSRACICTIYIHDTELIAPLGTPAIRSNARLKNCSYGLGETPV